MPSLDRIGDYVELVCKQIRWKKAHNRVSKEMTNHIIDVREHYISQGLDEDAATGYAIADTGDAAEIGAQLNKIHRPDPHNAIKVLVALFLGAAITIGYLYALTTFFPQKAIERAYFGPWGILAYVLILSSSGLLISIGASYKTSLFCSIGSPSIFVLAVFAYSIIAQDSLKIPQYNQYGVYNEMVSFGIYCFLVMPFSSISVSTFAYAICSLKRRRMEKYNLSE